MLYELCCQVLIPDFPDTEIPVIADAGLFKPEHSLLKVAITGRVVFDAQ